MQSLAARRLAESDKTDVRQPVADFQRAGNHLFERDVPFEKVIAGALEIRDRLKDIGLVGFCKTTGGKGLHVVTPLSGSPKDKLGWAEAKSFARELCVQVAGDNPKDYLVTMAKK